jgi:hypothetical protein
MGVGMGDVDGALSDMVGAMIKSRNGYFAEIQ